MHTDVIENFVQEARSRCGAERNEPPGQHSLQGVPLCSMLSG